MIFGNPQKFAILVELVPEWTTPGSYKNGLFHFIIGGKFMPDETHVATLSGDIHCLGSGNALVSQPEDAFLFKISKEQAFTKMLNAMLPAVLNPDVEIPDDFEADNRYKAATYNIDDHGYVFAVSFEHQIRIVGAKTSYLSGNSFDGMVWKDYDHFDVYEVILPKKEVLDIVNMVKSQVDTRC